MNRIGLIFVVACAALTSPARLIALQHCGQCRYIAGRKTNPERYA
jgi:hypothetical protein